MPVYFCLPKERDLSYVIVQGAYPGGHIKVAWPMKENEKALVAAFVGKQVQRIQRYRQQYDVSGLEQGSGELAFDLEKQGTDPATAHQHVEDALRYLVFYLADCALHSKANKVGILLNVHRMQCEKNLGRTGWYIGKWLFGRLMGFTHSPLRLAGFAFGVLAGVFTHLCRYNPPLGCSGHHRQCWSASSLVSLSLF